VEENTMPETTTEAPKARVKAVKAVKTEAATAGESDVDGAHDSYVVPLVGMRVPGVVVNVGFWGGLAGAAVLGAIDAPLAVLLGAGVLVARHRSNSNKE
jgi:hypothetical protein